MVFRKSTPQFRDHSGNLAAKSIASLEAVELGGFDQWILIRGRNKELPVILFLHGGPGNPQIVAARRYESFLEEHFVVVNWDQRGSGLSYAKRIPKGAMTIDQLVSDTIELSEKLCHRFGKDRIYLVGHSWGSLLGMLAIQKNPKLFKAFFGTGQFVCAKDAAVVGYNWALGQASKKDDVKAKSELMSEPENFRIRRKWIDKFGGYSSKKSLSGYAFDFAIHLREYSIFDLPRWANGLEFSERLLVPQAEAIDLRSVVERVETPVFFLQGSNDYVTPSELARGYMQGLECPTKEFVEFDNMSHMLPFDEPEIFGRAIADRAS